MQLAGVLALGVALLIGLLTTRSESVGTAVALVVLAALVAIALAAVLVGIWRGRAWVRAATVVFQVLLFAVGVGALQGAFAQPEWGWPLVLVGILGFGLAVARPTAAWLSGRDEVS